jgi:hypothetical protein
MAFSTAYDARVVSVLDYDCELPVHSSFHPVFKTAAKRRLQKAYPDYARALTQAFNNRAAARTWGILIEADGQPMCVVQNLACVVRNPSYRRVLRVNINDTYPGNRLPIDTSFLERNSRLPEGSGPGTSTRTVQ